MKIFSQTGFSALEQGSPVSLLLRWLSIRSVIIATGPLLFMISHTVLAVDNNKHTQILIVAKTKQADDSGKAASKTKKETAPEIATPLSSWISGVGKNPINSIKECQLSSANQFIFDGVSKIKIKFVFTRKHLFVLTNGNIDNSYKNTGLSVNTKDKSKKYTFDHISKKTNIVFTNFTNRHILRVINAQSVSVTLGFWPSWPKTKTRTVNIKLHGFNDAYRKFLKCKTK